MLGLLNRDGRLCQTTLAVSTRVFWLDASLRELRMGYLVEELGLGWKHLPLVSKISKVMEDSGSISSECVSRFVVTEQTNSIAKGLLVSTEFDSDEFLVKLDNDVLTLVGRAQVDLVLTLVRRRKLLGDGVSGKSVKLSLIFIVDPVVWLGIILICRSFDLKDIVSNANGNALDVRPVSNKLGTDMNVQSLCVSKLWIAGHYKITLSMVLIVLVLPSSDVGVATNTRVRVLCSRYAHTVDDSTAWTGDFFHLCFDKSVRERFAKSFVTTDTIS
mmetsp:Transcript_14745/g.35567  ORF Transcript_14745/g.35567 Transcript_14745/m.35567 type:complete len:273 (-) Transcript_14745:564-1382(-)